MSLMSLTAEEFEPFSSRGFTMHKDLYAACAYETKHEELSASELVLAYYFSTAYNS
jgi:hypothetical protein